MSGEISKQDQALGRAAQLVAEARQDLDAQCGALRGKLESVRGQWVGGAAGAFTQIMAQWDQDAKKIVSSLDAFEANLKKSEANYAAADEAQQQVFNRLSSRLG